MKLNGLKIMVALLVAVQGFAAKSDVTLAWDPVQETVITNYVLSWGTNSGVYVFQANTGTQNNLTVTGLAPHTVYYFVVQAVAQDGTQSPNSSEIIYSNPPAARPDALSVTGGSSGGGTTNRLDFGGSGSTGADSVPHGEGIERQEFPFGGGGSAGEVSVPGVPPTLGLSMSNQNPLLTVCGTLGSTLILQSSTNAATQAPWSTMTYLAMTNATAGAQTNQGSSTAISLAFVPATQDYEVIEATPPACEFYQAVMPYDYMVLADAVLSGQGYPSRLIRVRMPGIRSIDVCYVAAQSSFIYYGTANQAFGLVPSGSSIRQIADTLSALLGQNWTSASEFSYSNGLTSILATVVEAEPAGSDPVAAASTASIQIDF